ncbi:MAG: hypothetical protein SF123_09165 [Chloroflexota bacterium]|nr:hypothetical protein [Chloroflexota bacterium]
MADEPRRKRGTSGSANPYRTVSASERRARRRARDGSAPAPSTAAAARAEAAALPQEMVNELLQNPTKTVTEEQLRSEYGHVLADIRSMFLLALALVVLLIVLATVLPR